MRIPRRKDKSKSTAAQLDLFARPAPSTVVAEPKPQPPASVRNLARSEHACVQTVEDPLIGYIVGGLRGPGRPTKPLSTVAVQATDQDRLLDVREAASRLGLSKSTLDKMRCSGRGPRFIRATDRAVRYDPADLQAFADERRRRSTSDLDSLVAT